MLYLKDPKDGTQSVTLTFLVIAFVLVVGFSIATCLGHAKDADPLMQLFYACAALYFGRRVSIGNKTFGKDAPDA
jgi:hypothetical protein